MPELPEVENVKLSLLNQGLVGQRFARVEFLRKNLRTPLRPDLQRKLPGQSIQVIRRRAKFILFDTEDFILLSHLGMTGSWRLSVEDVVLTKHDHVVLHFESGLKMIYNDPRRFGVLELIPRVAVDENRWLRHLGVEPLDEGFHSEMLFLRTRKRKAPIKGFLMDQRHVVGVGNIYASEALYHAGVRPLRPAGRVTRAEAGEIVASIREILTRAIEAGGSTIRDYRNSNGESGQFQAQFSVYDREAAPCPRCGELIRAKMIAGRNTFWCRKCQR